MLFTAPSMSVQCNVKIRYVEGPFLVHLTFRSAVGLMEFRVKLTLIKRVLELVGKVYPFIYWFFKQFTLQT